MSGKKYIVTGALGCLGQAVCHELEALGHRVAMLDLAPMPENSEFYGIGGIDLADMSQVSAAVTAIVDQFGELDGLVNVAGGFLWELVNSGSVDSWDKMYGMNLRSAFLVNKAAGPYLRQGAAVVNIGAAAALRAAGGMAPYAASKAGVVSLTQSLAEEWREAGVRVNAILPTILDTPANRSDMPEEDWSTWVRPQDAAKVVAFLLSENAMCISGEAIRLS